MGKDIPLSKQEKKSKQGENFNRYHRRLKVSKLYSNGYYLFQDKGQISFLKS